MQNLKILNKKETKQILSIISKQFGCDVELDYVFMKNEKNKIFITNRQISEIDLSKLRVNSVGLYIAEQKDNQIRLSIEGSQLIGPYAKKNVVELNEEQASKWMKGEDLEIEGDYSGFVIIKYKKDFLGCGKYSNGRIWNYVNKIRRINA